MEKSDCENRFIDYFHYLEVTPVIILLLLFIWILLVPLRLSLPFILLVILVLYCISIVIFTIYPDSIHKKTINLIERFPEKGSENPHHAIIIAHKKDLVQGQYEKRDYLSGVGILIEKFQNSSERSVNYKIYEVNIKEKVIPVILDEKTTHLWIFGHGQRNKLRLMGENLCYFEVRNAPKKVFIGQYHCNSVFGTSLADYNKPDNQDVTRWLRQDPFIRFSVSKKLKELELKNLL